MDIYNVNTSFEKGIYIDIFPMDYTIPGITDKIINKYINKNICSPKTTDKTIENY